MLMFPAGIRRFVIPPLISYAAGTMLGASFLAMLPAALQHAPARAVNVAVLAGLVLFFVLEKLVIWRHAHRTGPQSAAPAAPLILIGNALHNFMDGVIIAAAFLTAVPLGFTTALAVIAHEIPQEVGDFAILLEGGYGRGKALVLNALSAAATLPGAIAAYFWLAELRTALPYILALAAASFIYIATADLLPGLQRQGTLVASLRQVGLLLAGIGTIALLHP
jgi:zinc and cadmium transporter